MMTARIETLKWTFEKTSRVSNPTLRIPEQIQSQTDLSTQEQQEIQQILKQSPSKIYAC
jgi:hypothetical protein